MERPTSYNTKQRQAVFAYIVSRENSHVTAAEIVAHFAEEGVDVGRTTIYRHLHKLMESGSLRKCSVDGIAGACFQLAKSETDAAKQLLLKCEGCGALIHLDCHVLQGVHQHIYEDHMFKVNETRTVFYGQCEACNYGG